MSNSKENSYNYQTLKSYNDKTANYIQRTPQVVDGFVKKWIDKAFTGLPKDSKILEIGSAFGRDADYIESLDFNVQRTDAAKEFVDYLNAQGKDARLLNIITDEIVGNYDVVFANAVLLHLDEQDFEGAIKKIYSALSSGGRLLMSLKKGDGSTWEDDKLGSPRFFCFWQPDQLQQALVDAGFENISIATSEEEKWLHVIALK